MLEVRGVRPCRGLQGRLSHGSVGSERWVGSGFCNGTAPWVERSAFEMNLCLDGAPVLWNKVQVNSENAEGSEIRKRGPGMLYFTLVPFSETHSAWITLFYLVSEGLGCDYSLSRAQGGGQ